MSRSTRTGGYIALVTTIILGLVLLTLLLVATNTGLLARFNILDTESKEVSVQVAYSCLDIALLKTTHDSSYAGGDVIPVGEYLCWILPRDTSEAIAVQAIVNNTYTNLKIDPGGEDFRECAYFTESSTCVLP